MPKAQRRQFSTEQKVALLRRHLIDGVPVSQLCEEAAIQPSLFYHWQQLLFENASRAFERPQPSTQKPKVDERVAFLEKRLARKDEVIAEISEEFVKLKKVLGEP
jgi:transposase-like protein